MGAQSVCVCVLFEVFEVIIKKGKNGKKTLGPIQILQLSVNRV